MIITASFELTLSNGFPVSCFASAGCVACVDKESLGFWLASTYAARNFKDAYLDPNSIKVKYGRNSSAVWMGKLI